MGQARSDLENQQVHALSFFALNGPAAQDQLTEYLNSSAPEALQSLIALADLHHITVRTFTTVSDLPPQLAAQIADLPDKNQQIIATVAEVCSELEGAGCPAMAIKSTDHWPDLGNDFDLFIIGSEQAVHDSMTKRFGAMRQPQSWGDRLACKWNYRVPGLTPLIEIHLNRLGQTGELTGYGRQMMQRRRMKILGQVHLPVPAPEDQIILSALQRLYRHFFFRICDFADVLPLFAADFDFENLRSISKQFGLWTGVATHLRVVSDYAFHYRGVPVVLPASVRKAAKFGGERLYPHASYLRVPLFPQGASLYGKQVVKTIRRGDTAGALRLGLLPPLAAAAGAAYKASGKQNGFW